MRATRLPVSAAVNNNIGVRCPHGRFFPARGECEVSDLRKCLMQDIKYKDLA